MKVHVSIGENHRFELREALLVYRDQQSSFITRHDVTAHKDAPPTLGPAQPLTVAFIESMVRSLSGSVEAEVLPANILARADRVIVWWTPAQRRQMFYENSEGKAAELNGRVFPQPPLVWRVSNGNLNIRALTENMRPEGSSKLAVAPYWNLSDDGRVCTGTMRRPDTASVGAIPSWERGFYESAFTHANVGRLTRHEGGFEGLWTGLAGKRRRFPLQTLIALPQTLRQFVRGDPLPSCSAVEALDRQEPFINQTLASSALAMLARLFRYGKLTHHGGFFNAQSGLMSPLPVDPQLWSKTRRRARRQ